MLITDKNDQNGVLAANSFSFLLKNTDQKDICSSIVFKAEIQRTIFFFLFFKTQKQAFSGVQNSSF